MVKVQQWSYANGIHSSYHVLHHQQSGTSYSVRMVAWQLQLQCQLGVNSLQACSSVLQKAIHAIDWHQIHVTISLIARISGPGIE